MHEDEVVPPRGLRWCRAVVGFAGCRHKCSEAIRRGAHARSIPPGRGDVVVPLLAVLWTAACPSSPSVSTDQPSRAGVEMAQGTPCNIADVAHALSDSNGSISCSAELERLASFQTLEYGREFERARACMADARARRASFHAAFPIPWGSGDSVGVVGRVGSGLLVLERRRVSKGDEAHHQILVTECADGDFDSSTLRCSISTATSTLCVAGSATNLVSGGTP